MTPRRAGVLLAGYLVVVAVLAFSPLQRRLADGARSLLAETVPATWSGRGVGEPLANVAFFVPLALLLCLALPRVHPLAVLVGCVLASVGIEVTQAVFLPARTPSVLDVAANSAGALLGVVLHQVIVAVRRSRDQDGEVPDA